MSPTTTPLKLANTPLRIIRARIHAPKRAPLAVLGAVLAAVLLVAWHLHAAFRTTPANFPTPRAAPSSNILTDPVQMDYRKSKRVER
jgi:hypothetical protein